MKWGSSLLPWQLQRCTIARWKAKKKFVKQIWVGFYKNVTHNLGHVWAKNIKVKSKLSQAKTEVSGFYKNVTHDLHFPIPWEWAWHVPTSTLVWSIWYVQEYNSADFIMLRRMESVVVVTSQYMRLCGCGGQDEVDARSTYCRPLTTIRGRHGVCGRSHLGGELRNMMGIFIK